MDTGVDTLKIAPKKVVQKAAEATAEFLGNKNANKIVKPKCVIDENRRNVEEIIILSKKRDKILNEIRLVL